MIRSTISILTLALLLLPRIAIAQNSNNDDAAAADSSEFGEEAEKNKPFFGKPTRQMRKSTKFTANATIFSYGLIIFYRTGFSLGYHLSKNLIVEPEYFGASISFAYKDINFGAFSEKYYLLPLKFYTNSNSFYLTTGIGQRRIEAKLGDEMLSRVTGEKFDIDVISIKNNILELGLGNRWQYENGFTITANWLELYIPIGEAETTAPFLDYVVNEDDRKKVKNVIDFIDNLPTFAIAKIQLGYTF